LISFIADWQIYLRDLRRANQPLSQHQAIDVLQKCFGPEFDDWVKFVQDTLVPADRTVILLGAAIIAFDKDVLPIRAAQRAIGINQVVNQTAMLAQMQDEIAELRQALAAQVRPAPRKRGGGGHHLLEILGHLRVQDSGEQMYLLHNVHFVGRMAPAIHTREMPARAGPRATRSRRRGRTKWDPTGRLRMPKTVGPQHDV